MRYIKILISFALLLSLCSFACIPVLSHSGRTDSKGGHHNTFTGTYHYHHGMPAHDHYDINRDGVLDCPYEYQENKKDNSSQNSNGFLKWLKKQSPIDLILRIIILSPFIICFFGSIISFFKRLVCSITNKKKSQK